MLEPGRSLVGAEASTIEQRSSLFAGVEVQIPLVERFSEVSLT